MCFGHWCSLLLSLVKHAGGQKNTRFVMYRQHWSIRIRSIRMSAWISSNSYKNVLRMPASDLVSQFNCTYTWCGACRRRFLRKKSDPGISKHFPCCGACRRRFFLRKKERSRKIQAFPLPWSMPQAFFLWKKHRFKNVIRMSASRKQGFA